MNIKHIFCVEGAEYDNELSIFAHDEKIYLLRLISKLDHFDLLFGNQKKKAKLVYSQKTVIFFFL